MAKVCKGCPGLKAAEDDKMFCLEIPAVTLGEQFWMLLPSPVLAFAPLLPILKLGQKSMLQTVLAFSSPCPNLLLRSPLTKVTLPELTTQQPSHWSPNPETCLFQSHPSSSLPWEPSATSPLPPLEMPLPSPAPIPQLKASESEKGQEISRNVVGLRERENFFSSYKRIQKTPYPLWRRLKIVFHKRCKMSLDSWCLTFRQYSVCRKLFGKGHPVLSFQESLDFLQ